MDHPPGPELPLLSRASDHAGRVALTAPEGTFTYGQLLRASAGVARGLLQGRADLGEGRVAFLVAPGFGWAAVQWGIWRAGGVAVPLAAGQPARELRHVLEDCEADLVILGSDSETAVRATVEGLGVAVLSSESLVAPDPQGPPGTTLPTIAANRRAMILYTSGTTGRPKGVVSTHANLEAQVGSLVEAWAWRPEDHVLLVLPLHHVHGIVNVVTCALWSGARCSVLPGFDAHDTWEQLARGGLTLFMAVPTIYQRLLSAWDDAAPSTRDRWGEGARRLRLYVSGSAALPIRILERWEAVTGHRLLERYGMTEIGMALSNPLDGKRRAGHVGQPLPGVRVRLVDGGGREVSDGESGAIEVQGPSVFREYWRRPEETREAFTAHGWFRTGDVAIVEDGSYRILGRASVDIIKTGGEKVSALEIEDVLREHPAISDTAVVGVPDPEWGERVSAAVVLATAASPPPLEELRDWARDRLSPWKIPRAVEWVEALPRNAMGKVDKPAVKRWFEAS